MIQLILNIQNFLLNELYIWAMYLFYITYGHLYFWILGSIPFVPLVTISLFLLFFFQGNAYSSMPFYAMRRNLNKKQHGWESFDFHLTIDDTLLSSTYKDDYQSWKELGDRSNTFYQIRSKHYLRHIQDQYEAANYEPKEYSKLPLCSPHYQHNLLNYDLEEDLNDIMPSITSICPKDASSVLWQLKPDSVFLRWTNALTTELWRDRNYRLAVTAIDGNGEDIDRQRRFYAILSKPLVRFPDLLRAIYPNDRTGYISRKDNHSGYPINNPKHRLVHNWVPNFDSITTRSNIYPNLTKHNNQDVLYQDITFLSFKTAFKSIFAFTLFLRYFRKLNFLIRQNLYTEVEQDPFFLRLLRLHNLVYPILKFKLNLTPQTEKLKKIFKIQNNPLSKKKKKLNKRYKKLIKTSRGRLLHDMFIQTTHTMPNDVGGFDSQYFAAADNMYTGYDFADGYFPILSSTIQYVEDRVQAQSALLPLQFEYEEDRNIDLFLEDNVEPFSYHTLSLENPFPADNYEIIVEGLDNFQDGDSNLTDPILDTLRIIQTYYLMPVFLLIFLKTTSVMFFLAPFLMSDLYLSDEHEDATKDNLKYPSTIIKDRKKTKTFFTDDFFWIYTSNEYAIIDEECYEDIVYDHELDYYDDGWEGTQTDNDFFFNSGLKKQNRIDNLIAEVVSTGRYFKDDNTIFEATYMEDNYYSYSFSGKDVPKSFTDWKRHKKNLDILNSTEFLQIMTFVHNMVFWLLGDKARFYYLSELRKKPPIHSFLPRNYDFEGDEESLDDDLTFFHDPEDPYAVHNLMENYAGFELEEGDSFGHEESIYLDENVYDGSGPECYTDIKGESDFIPNYSYAPYPTHLLWDYDVTMQYPASPTFEFFNYAYFYYIIANREEDLEEFLIAPLADEYEYTWYDNNGEVDDFDLTDPFVYDEEFGEDITDPSEEADINELHYTLDQFEPENRSIYEDASDDHLETDNEDAADDELDFTLIEENAFVENEFKQGEATILLRICAHAYNLLRKILKF